MQISKKNKYDLYISKKKGLPKKTFFIVPYKPYLAWCGHSALPWLGHCAGLCWQEPSPCLHFGAPPDFVIGTPKNFRQRVFQWVYGVS